MDHDVWDMLVKVGKVVVAVGLATVFFAGVAVATWFAGYWK